MDLNNLFNPIFLLSLPVFLFSLTVHEFAHAWTARKGGDDTAYLMGRLTLNPASHIDPIGTVLIPIMAALSNLPFIGWAKPVPVNPARLKNSLWMVWVAIAGPISNVLIMILTVLLLKVWVMASGMHGLSALASRDNLGSAVEAFLTIGLISINVNILLAIFNMLPIPPLDGSRVFFHFVVNGRPQLYSMWEKVERFSFILLYLFILLPPTSWALFQVIKVARNFVLNFLG